MKRIAIFLRGGISIIDGKLGTVEPDSKYVDIECTKKSIQKHIIEANPDCEFDFFIHSWNVDLQDKLISLYSPKSFLFENNKDYTQEIQSKLYSGGQFAQASHFLSYKKACELVSDYSMRNNIEYDLIVAYRPDLMLWKDMKFENYDKSKVTVNNWENCIGDFHVVFSPKYMNRMIGMYHALGIIIPHPHCVIISAFHDVITMDNIRAGIDQEITRKMYRVYTDGVLTEDQLNYYGLTIDEVIKYCDIY